MEGGSALNPPAPSWAGRPLGIVVWALGILAALPVLATLILLGVDGHPEGLLCAVAGGAVPALLWGARRTQARLWSFWADRKVTRMAELKVVLEDMPPLPPPSSTILVPLGGT